MVMPGLPRRVPAATPLTVIASSTASKRIGTLLKLSIRSATDQLPSACTVSCWMLAAGSDTRLAGPVEQAARTRQVSARMAATGRRFIGNGSATGVAPSIHRRMVGPPSGLLLAVQEGIGVHRAAAPPLLLLVQDEQSEVQVRRVGAGVAGAADIPDHLAALHGVAFGKARRITLQVRVVVAPC